MGERHLKLVTRIDRKTELQRPRTNRLYKWMIMATEKWASLVVVATGRGDIKKIGSSNFAHGVHFY